MNVVYRLSDGEVIGTTGSPILSAHEQTFLGVVDVVALDNPNILEEALEFLKDKEIKYDIANTRFVLVADETVEYTPEPVPTFAEDDDAYATSIDADWNLTNDTSCEFLGGRLNDVRFPGVCDRATIKEIRAHWALRFHQVAQVAGSQLGFVPTSVKKVIFAAKKGNWADFYEAVRELPAPIKIVLQGNLPAADVAVLTIINDTVI